MTESAVKCFSMNGVDVEFVFLLIDLTIALDIFGKREEGLGGGNVTRSGRDWRLEDRRILTDRSTGLYRSL